MSIRAVLAVTLAAVVGFASQAEAITLEQAASSGAIDLEITSARSYHSIRIRVRNLTNAPITVSALPGTVFENDVLSEQDVTLAEPLALTISPGKSIVESVATYCIRPHDGPPTAAARFHARGFDRSIAAFLRAHPAVHGRDTTQSELWQMIDAHPSTAVTPRTSTRETE
jgi:hypothetical protein